MIEAERIALRRRYARERDKRLRPDGNDQYLELKGPFSQLLEDPYTPRTERDPRRDHVTVAFIGGGFAGLVTGARLREAGVADVRIVEKGGGFGGTWYWNRYPGAQCDTSAMIYMPLLEETGHMPSERYAHAPEIRAHCDRIARQYGLYDDALFHTEVTGLEWDAAGGRWIVRTNRADEFTARFVGIGTGPLHVAKLPGIPGLATFAGHAFHTSRWDYAYTGGDPDGAPMDSTTSTSAPTTCPRCTWWTPTARASNGSLPPGSWWPGLSTRSTASSTPRASRSAPRRPGGTGST
jgi:hypothetical protein